jgi:hypothetical protein
MNRIPTVFPDGPKHAAWAPGLEQPDYFELLPLGFHLRLRLPVA